MHPIFEFDVCAAMLQVRLCRLLTLECFAGNPLVPPRTARQALKQVLRPGQVSCCCC